MPWLQPAPGSVQSWYYHRTTLGNWHLAKCLIFLLCVLRIESVRGWSVIAAIANAVAWCCCTWATPAARSHEALQTVCFIVSMVSFTARAMSHYRWQSMPVLTPVIERACSSHSIYIFLADVVLVTVDKIYAWMFLPGVAVAIISAVHIRYVYALLKRVQGHPNFIITAVWVAVELGLPHLLLHYMHKTTQQHGRATQHAPHRRIAAAPDNSIAGGAAGSKAAKPLSSSPEHDDNRSKPGVQAKGSTGEGSHRASRKADTGGTHAMGLQGTASGQSAGLTGQPEEPLGASATSTEPAPVAPSRTAHSGVSSNSSLQTVGSLGHGSLSMSAEVQRAFENAQALMRRASPNQMYRSRLVQPQAVIKLMDTEPDQLRQDVIAAVNNAMNQGRAGMAISRACVRMGCTLLVLDLALLPDSSERSHYAWETDIPAEAWLESLLAPGTPIPDGAVAHLSLGSRHYKAFWQQQEGAWVVSEASGSTAAASLDCALQFVHRPVARQLLRSSSAEVHSNVHRVSLLLQTNQALLFVGSDQSSSAIPEQPVSTDGAPVSVQCVARGCWGTCLPVVVAGVEGTGDGTSSGAIALTLDVDPSQAPVCGGAVQLELWCGRAILASAPLLILPADSPAQPSDALLEELQGHAESVLGTSALLTDLGQVLFGVGCVQQHLDNTSSKGASSNSVVPNSGPSSSSWGGIVSSLAAQHASDPATLSWTHELASGLLEYAKSEGLKHAAALLVSDMMTLHQRLEAVKGTAGSPSSLSPAAAAPSKVEESKAGANAEAAAAAAAASSANSGLRQRNPQHTGLDKPPAKSGWKEAGAQQPHQRGSSVSQQTVPRSQQRLSWPTVATCIRDAVFGYESQQVEEQYKLWVAQRHNRFLSTYTLLLCLWIIASCVRSWRDGWQAFLDHLPIHLAAIVPLATTLVLTLVKQYRYQELALVLHPLGRALAGTMAATSGHVPPTYGPFCRMHMNVLLELFLYPLAEPLRLPALIPHHALALSFDVCNTHICGCRGARCLLQAVALRLCALAIGLGMDVSRRYTFMHEQPAAQLRHEVNGQQQGALKIE